MKNRKEEEIIKIVISAIIILILGVVAAAKNHKEIKTIQPANVNVQDLNLK